MSGWTTKDSGKREEFPTGSTRDTREGKGRYDLIAPRAALLLLEKTPELVVRVEGTPSVREGSVLGTLLYALPGIFGALAGESPRQHLCEAAAFCLRAMEIDSSLGSDGTEQILRGFVLFPRAMHRLAGVYERGAAKYGDRNWERGQPVSRYLDSALRHIFLALDGQEDEDHLAQGAWNLFAAIETLLRLDEGLLPRELNDLRVLAGQAGEEE